MYNIVNSIASICLSFLILTSTFTSNTLFIGDSNTKGLLNNNEYECWVDSEFLCENGYSIHKCIADDYKMGRYNIIDYISESQPEAIFIMLGTNDLGCDIDSLYDNWIEFICKIQEVAPNTTIYIQSVLPIYKEYSNVTNANVQEMNIMLQKVAKHCNVYYIDVTANTKDDNGFLKQNLRVDNIHLNKDGCYLWLLNLFKGVREIHDN
jgi:lysophospholipase L1-like esterase